MNELTDKQIKTAIVYGETPESMTPEQKYNFDAYSALWERIKHEFITDEDLKPMNPNKAN